LFLPALGIALDRLAVRYRLADSVDVAHATLAVVPDLCLARRVHLAVPRGVARLLATVLAVLKWLTARSTTTLL